MIIKLKDADFLFSVFGDVQHCSLFTFTQNGLNTLETSCSVEYAKKMYPNFRILGIHASENKLLIHGKEV